MLILFSKCWQGISGNCHCLHMNSDYLIQCKLHVSQWPVSFRHKCMVSIHILLVCVTAFNHYTVKATKYMNWGSNPLGMYLGPLAQVFFFFGGGWFPESLQLLKHFIEQGCQLLRLYSIDGRWMKCWYKSIGGMVKTGETEILEEESVSVPFYPPQIAHGLPWDQTWAFVVWGQWLTNWLTVT